MGRKRLPPLPRRDLVDRASYLTVASIIATRGCANRSIWRRRPIDAGAVPAYLAGSILYKKMNWLWPALTRARMTHAVWRPLITLSRVLQSRRIAKSRPPVYASPAIPAARSSMSRLTSKI
jgi:hypothetical protein